MLAAIIDTFPLRFFPILKQNLMQMRCSVHEQTTLSNDIIDSVLQHREVSRPKDLSAPPHIAAVTSEFSLGGSACHSTQFYHCCNSLVDGFEVGKSLKF